jgi:uncharacterized protein (TIGR02996 family)
LALSAKIHPREREKMLQSPRTLSENCRIAGTRNETEEALIRSCLEYPWDDARFLIFSDWLEENEFFEVADYIRNALSWAETWRRPPTAVREYWASRMGSNIAEKNGYIRGFPAILSISLEDWLNDPPENEEFFWGLNLSDFTIDHFVEFLSSERLANLSVLSLNPIRLQPSTVTIQQLLSSRRVMNRINALDHLCVLNLRNTLLGQLHTETLLQSIQFRNLQSLVLEGNIVAPAFLFQEDWQHLRTIRSLDLASNRLNWDLSGSSGFRLYGHLQYLRLSSNKIIFRPNSRKEPQFPELLVLDLAGACLSNDSLRALATSEDFPKLERLNLSSHYELSPEIIADFLKGLSLPRLKWLHIDRFYLNSVKKAHRIRSIAQEKKIEIIS